MSASATQDATSGMSVAVTVLILALGFALCAAMAVWARRRLRGATPTERRRALITGAVVGTILVVVFVAFRVLHVPGY